MRGIALLLGVVTLDFGEIDRERVRGTTSTTRCADVGNHPIGHGVGEKVHVGAIFNATHILFDGAQLAALGTSLVQSSG